MLNSLQTAYNNRKILSIPKTQILAFAAIQEGGGDLLDPFFLSPSLPELLCQQLAELLVVAGCWRFPRQTVHGRYCGGGVQIAAATNWKVGWFFVCLFVAFLPLLMEIKFLLC